MNRFEMFLKLLENPKRKAKNSCGDLVEMGFNKIVWVENKNGVGAMIDQSETWEIIEPERKLKEMYFGEAIFYMYNHFNLKLEEMISLVTGRHGKRPLENLTIEELMGKWTINGIYADEEKKQ